MSVTIESMFVVTENGPDGQPVEPYVLADLTKLGKKYAPKIKPGIFEKMVLEHGPEIYGVSVRKATAKDAKDFMADEEVHAAVYEYTHMDEYVEKRNTANADIIIGNAVSTIKDEAGLERFLGLHQLSTSQLQAIFKKTTSMVKASDEWIDLVATYVASKSTGYTTKAGLKRPARTKGDVVAELTTYRNYSHSLE